MSRDKAVQAEYARLREGTISALDALSDAENLSAQADAALRNLRSLLSGEVPGQLSTGPEMLDPFDHILTVRRFTGDQAEPISLLQRAADLRRQLGGDRGPDERLPGEPSGNVVVTELRAMIIAGLLKVRGGGAV